MTEQDEQTPAFRAFREHLRTCRVCANTKQSVFGLVTECETNVELFKAMMNERGADTQVK